MAGLRQEIETAKEETDTVLQAKTLAEKQLKDAKRKLDSATAENRDLSSRIEELLAEASQKDATIETLKGRVAQLEILNKDLNEKQLAATSAMILLKERHQEDRSCGVLERERISNQNVQLLRLLDYKEKQFLRILGEEGINVGQSELPFGMANTLPNNLNMLNILGGSSASPSFHNPRQDVFDNTEQRRWMDNAERWRSEASRH
ncbi:MAG: hypothetical protein JST59_00640 [Actinobacteria bacterium]|nr:hypothetical protein [Actinomycetota bacterium]